MACLQVQVTAHPLAIVPISVSLNNTYLKCNVKRVGGIEAYATRSDTPVVLHVVDVASHLKLSCGIVCSVGDVHYLRVLPHEIQWITPDEAIVYMVESDTNWTIVTS